MFNFLFRKQKKSSVPYIKIFANGTFELSDKYISFADLAAIDETYSDSLAAAVLAFNDEDKGNMREANQNLIKMQEQLMSVSATESDDDKPYIRAIDAFTNHTNPQ